MASDYQPLIREYFQAILDNEKPAPTPSHADDRRRRARDLERKVNKAEKALQRKLDKGHKWFEKYGGWGAEEPKKKPKAWKQNNDLFQQQLWDYELIVCAKKLGREFLWFPERD